MVIVFLAALVSMAIAIVAVAVIAHSFAAHWPQVVEALSVGEPATQRAAPRARVPRPSAA